MKKILSIAFSLLILLGNVGLAKTVHFCMGDEKDAAIGFSTSHVDCEMKKKTSDCHSQKESSSHEEEDCCDEEYELLVLDQDIQKSQVSNDISFDFVIAYVYTHIGLPFFSTDKNTNYQDYPPPVLKNDLQVLHQTFLI